ncbi:fimbria/pilus periplasmic chaperone [Caballeronia sp. GaOx3]|uniref:fimbria/pilus periplasmic chaperone n=1 Tax=Caballeronia sp. GaOx3 TaxID=2921740 RepID=UPI00202930F5|nr:fimbria/pilus periplasmic chaperone [Caballeronia sp. GaOx3]
MSGQRINFDLLSFLLKIRFFKDSLRRKSNVESPLNRQDRIENKNNVPLKESLAIGARSIVLDPSRRDTSVVLQNVGETRLIVYPSIHRCPESHATSVMVNPPCCELDAGAATVLNYLAVCSDTDTEQLFRARFEWIDPDRTTFDDGAEKSIPLLVRPCASNDKKNPCQRLTASVSRYGDVIIENHSSEIVCLGPVVVLLPSEQKFVVPQRYVAPGSWILARSVCAGLPSCTIRVTVETLSGAPISSVDVPLRKLNCVTHS